MRLREEFAQWLRRFAVLTGLFNHLPSPLEPIPGSVRKTPAFVLEPSHHTRIRTCNDPPALRGVVPASPRLALLHHSHPGRAFDIAASVHIPRQYRITRQCRNALARRCFACSGLAGVQALTTGDRQRQSPGELMAVRGFEHFVQSHGSLAATSATWKLKRR